MREIKVQMEIERDGETWIMTNSLFDLQNGMCYYELGKGCKINWYRQYTGLKDKNGVEIYEGDIIEWHFNHGFKEKNEQVMHSLNWDGKFNSETAPFISAWGSTCGSFYRTFMNVYDPARFAIVIGNIYQNPELLK